MLEELPVAQISSCQLSPKLPILVKVVNVDHMKVAETGISWGSFESLDHLNMSRWLRQSSFCVYNNIICVALLEFSSCRSLQHTEVGTYSEEEIHDSPDKASPMARFRFSRPSRLFELFQIPFEVTSGSINIFKNGRC